MKRTIRKKSVLPNRKKLNEKIFFIQMVFCSLFLVMAIRVSYIVVVNGDKYAKGTNTNLSRSEKIIEAPRGIITDRNQRTLATNLPVYNIILSPYELLNHVKEEVREETYKALAEVVEGKTAQDIKKSVEARAKSKWLPLAQKLALEDATYNKLIKLGGVSLEKTYIRNYPSGELAAQVLGFYNKNNQGQYGIEQQYEEYLAGRPGRMYEQFKENGIVTEELQSPVQGATVTLTLDKMVQQYMTETMNKYVKKYNPKSASAIIMNPNTGEILGMYSYPSFNPNTYNDLSKQLGSNIWFKMEQQDQTKALLNAWRNQAIQYNYEPGSTFKPLLVAMALEESAINTTDVYNCTGGKRVEDRIIHCWKREGHGTQTLSEALANSCNVAMMEIANKLDDKVFMEYVDRYGFGELTGIELAGEEKGIIHQSLGPVEKATSSIGQTFKVTPIQLITAISSIINGGYLMEPYVVSEIQNQSGEILQKHDPVTKRQVISSNVSQIITDDLKKVVDEGGTGVTASIPGYNIGGKTGTGQKFIEGTNKRDPNMYVISFMGFAPIENPEVIALIVFDNMPEHTGASTGAFKDMMENIFPYLEIPTNTTVSSSEDKKENVTVKVPNVSGSDLYEAINNLQSKGLSYKIEGNGTYVSEQYPKGDEMWGSQDKVVLYTTTNHPKDLLEVPNLIGKTFKEAKEIVGDTFNLVGNQGKIISQIPVAGTKIEKGNKIIVEIKE